ncbi:Ig-like domain-containing protein [Exiguobacterium sp. s138]|uniref:Ig-like domain-containing protein n=1 Tax=Exiguobacterium sp. s138 TaxID=2751202 RepID=UPI001BE8D96C|nr:Ig-like domain-containing protein [Exiguobacterium sp. s138]
MKKLIHSMIVVSTLYAVGELNYDTVQAGSVLDSDSSNARLEAGMTVKDTTAPEILYVYSLKENETSVSGVTEPSVIITVKVGTETIGTTTADENGEFSVSIPSQKLGMKLSVTATDLAGNSSEPSEIIVEDGTPPPPPQVNELNESSRTVSGRTEPYATILVMIRSSIVALIQADGEGFYEVGINNQVARTRVTVAAQDAAGNRSLDTDVFVKDIIPPGPAWVFEVTDKSTVITGKAEAYCEVMVREGTKYISGSRVNSDRSYEIYISPQKGGTKLNVVVVDNDGNMSEPTEIVVKDTTAPSAPRVNKVTDLSATVSGISEVNSRITIKSGKKVIGEGLTGKNGAFSVKIKKQKANAELFVYATDKAGNISRSAKIKVLDKTPPAVPSVTAVSDQSTLIKGKAETDARVYLKINGKLSGVSKAEQGLFYFNVSKLKAGTQIIVYAIDQSGNRSNDKKLTVLDRTAPKMPTVNKVTSTSGAVSGKTERHAQVIIYSNSKKIGEGFADSKGSFRIQIKKQKRGTALKIVIQDQAGNKSQEKRLTVN